MNIKYVAGVTNYSEDPAMGRYIEVRYMETPLTACVANRCQSCVNLLLAAGTDVNLPDSLGLTPLMHAVVSDQPAMQTILLFNGADVNAMDHFYKTALHRSVEMQHIALMEALVVHGAEVTAEHLIEAAHHGNHHLLRVLLTRHEQVKLNKRYNGEVALCVSVWRAHHHCSKLLIELGADVNALTNYGESTLLGASAHGD